MLATSSNNDSDPDYIADGLSDQQNRRELRTLAEACDRYQISERARAAIASSVLVDFDLITRDKIQNVIGDFYLDHFSPESGKGIDIAHGIYKKVCGTELENRLSLVKADGTNVNTGHRNGSIRYLEMFLGKPLQHDICLLHLNELPLRHVFMKLDSTTKGPDKFAGFNLGRN
ncbi:hypothetical protein Anas_12324 [Armadillidium nasatum]|uniref:Uncharacterized protein n=1 Tax=Armadillidium nasatum TaxID=96803 RepID=A0A5N5SZN2_9CRUS|nr:hypothetical protein Anas_12324 [Armadillidium nasatum]